MKSTLMIKITRVLESRAILKHLSRDRRPVPLLTWRKLLADLRWLVDGDGAPQAAALG